MVNVIKICHVVHELWTFSLTGNGQKDGWTKGQMNTHRDYSAVPRVVQSSVIIKLDITWIHCNSLHAWL